MTVMILWCVYCTQLIHSPISLMQKTHGHWHRLVYAYFNIDLCGRWSIAFIRILCSHLDLKASVVSHYTGYWIRKLWMKAEQSTSSLCDRKENIIMLSSYVSFLSLISVVNGDEETSRQFKWLPTWFCSILWPGFSLRRGRAERGITKQRCARPVMQGSLCEQHRLCPLDFTSIAATQHFLYLTDIFTLNKRGHSALQQDFKTLVPLPCVINKDFSNRGSSGLYQQ